MIEPKLIAVIPAVAGWYVVDTVLGKDQKPLAEIWRQPVIAWKIYEWPTGTVHRVDECPSYGHPVCAETINKEYCLLAPDGHVVCPEINNWDTVEDFLKFKMSENS